MRGLILFGLIGLVASSAHAQQRPNKPAAPLPVFSFLGDDTETPTKRMSLFTAACNVNGDLTTCDEYSDPKIAGTDLKWLSISYNRGLLYAVSGATWTNRYDTLLDAFTAKYGAPKVEVRKWQAKSGATFDNAVAVWKFKGGVLELASLGPDLNTTSFTFVSTNNAPAREKPKIDF